MKWTKQQHRLQEILLPSVHISNFSTSPHYLICLYSFLDFRQNKISANSAPPPTAPPARLSFWLMSQLFNLNYVMIVKLTVRTVMQPEPDRTPHTQTQRQLNSASPRPICKTRLKENIEFEFEKKNRVIPLVWYAYVRYLHTATPFQNIANGLLCWNTS